MNPFQQAHGWLAAQLFRFAASPVEYQFAATGQRIAVSAVFGSTQAEWVDQPAAGINASCQDILIRSSELTIPPQPGDRIITSQRTFEVMNWGTDGCWRWCDSCGITRRIHTKEITPS